MQSRKRILVSIVGQGSIAHIIRSGILNDMKEFCEPVVAMLWHQPDLEAELISNNIEVQRMPDFSLSTTYVQLRSKIDQWYKRAVLRSPSTNIQQRYLDQYIDKRKKIKRAVRNIFEYSKQLIPGYIQNLIREEMLLIQKEGVYERYDEWFKALNISGLYTVTPFYPQVELIGRLCKNANLPIVASIHSFDNVTKRPWPAIFFDHYIVWNNYNKSELQRINPGLNGNEITIAGAPQFDYHLNRKSAQSKEEWMQQLKVPAGKKVILYGGGPARLFPNEPQYLKHLNEAFVKGQISTNAIILFRSHPLDKLDRWKKYVGISPYIIYDEAPNGTQKLDYTNVKESDINKLISSLKYTDVHINLCSTMAVDGCVFNKPQIGPAYDVVNPSKQHLLRRMYDQEHYLPIIKTDAVHLANSKNELVHLVNDALDFPSKYNGNSDQCVKEIITYTDGRSGERVVQVLKTFFSV